MTPPRPMDKIDERLMVGPPFVMLEIPIDESMAEISWRRILSSVWYCGRSVRREWNDRNVRKQIPRITRVAMVVRTTTAGKSDSPLFFSQYKQGRRRRVRISAIKKMVMTCAVILTAMIIKKMSAMKSSMRSVRDASAGNMIIILYEGYYTIDLEGCFMTVTFVPGITESGFSNTI